jgi:hypothetical protein
MKCNFAVGPYTLCSDSTCPVCNITRNGFVIFKTSSKFGWSRFGRGIYSTATHLNLMIIIKEV